MSTIRIWRAIAEECAPWHVSIGDASPLQDLRKWADEEVGFRRGAPAPGSDFGLCWDEALGALSLYLIAPGATGPLLRYAEPPLDGGWSLVMEFIPVGPAEWRVVAARKDWGRLQLGEALAMFVVETFNRSWTGFSTKRRESFALVPLHLQPAGSL